MSSARSHDTESKHRNQLHLCLLAVNNETNKIPQEIINQYPYGEFPIKYTKCGQEQIRKCSENRFSRVEEVEHRDKQEENTSLDLMSLLPLFTLMSNKKQPKDTFELLSSFLFKDKPELKKLFNMMPKPQNQEIISHNEFPNTNKVSISSLKRINNK